jgi:hypothetical protein
MRLLLDTNIFLEAILGQTSADDVKLLLAQGDAHELFLSDFSLHSIGTPRDVISREPGSARKRPTLRAARAWNGDPASTR